MRHARSDYNGRVVDLAEPRIRDSFGALCQAINDALASGAISDSHKDAIGIGVGNLGEALYGGPWIAGQSWEEAGITPIPDDEPVFLLRGQDAVASATVETWAARHTAMGGDQGLADSAREHVRLMDAWPVKKVADLPSAVDTGETAGEGELDPE